MTCPFCLIIAGRTDTRILKQYPRAIAITPLNPVTPGHTLIIPFTHVYDYLTDARVTADVMWCAADYARDHAMYPSNLITSAGSDATQTVTHFHIHLVPRAAGDGLALPWDPTPGRQQ